MSLANEVQNLYNNYKNIKKAVIGRGGEISATAGLVELPGAIFNIPADISIARYDDDSIAYEKSVPSGVEEYALVKSLGGMSTLVKDESNNLCICDGEYDLSTKEYLQLDFGVLEAGEYYLRFEGSGIDVAYISGNGATVGPYGTDGWSFENPITIRAFGGENVSATLESEYWNGGEGNYYMGGTITGIMLCKADDPDKTYKPYPKTKLVSAKPTSLESRGNNLCSTDGVYQCSGSSTYIPLGRFDDFEDGEYYISFNNRELRGFYEATIKFPSGEYQFGTFSTSCTFNIDDDVRGEDCFLDIRGESYWFSPEYDGASDLSGVVKNIMICKNDVPDKTYTPFSAEPIDLKELPEAVQSLEGWGLGKDAKYNNHIVWKNGKIFYVQMLDELDLGDFTWRMFTSNKYFVTYPTVDKWSTAWNGVNMKTQNTTTKPTLLCSKYSVDTYNNVAYANLSEYVSYRTDDASYGTMIVVRDLNYDNAKDLKAALKGVKLIYPIAEPIETDITHLFTDTSPFLKVQGSGIIIANNEHKQSLPSTIKYVIKTGA